MNKDTKGILTVIAVIALGFIIAGFMTSCSKRICPAYGSQWTRHQRHLNR
jgi:hypothetical protein